MAFKVKSILHGAGSILELMPSERPYDIVRPLVVDSDIDALARDWQQVGDAFRKAINIGSEDVQRHGQGKAKPTAS